MSQVNLKKVAHHQKRWQNAESTPCLKSMVYIQLFNWRFPLIQELDETWKGMRWLLDTLYYARDRESVSGIPLDLVFDTRRPSSPEPYDSHRKHTERKITMGNGKEWREITFLWAIYYQIRVNIKVNIKFSIKVSISMNIMISI